MGFFRRRLERLCPFFLAAASAAALVLQFVDCHSDSKVRINQIKAPLSPPSFPFIRLLHCHRHPLHPLLRRAPCIYRATTSHHFSFVQFRLELEAPGSRSMASDGRPRHAFLPQRGCGTALRAGCRSRLLPPMHLITDFLLLCVPRCAPLGHPHQVLAGVPVDEASFAAHVVASLVLTGIVAVLLPVAVLCFAARLWVMPLVRVVVMAAAIGIACASPSSPWRWPPLRSGSVWAPPWWAPFGSSGWCLWVLPELWSVNGVEPPRINASSSGGRWLLAINFHGADCLQC